MRRRYFSHVQLRFGTSLWDQGVGRMGVGKTRERPCRKNTRSACAILAAVSPAKAGAQCGLRGLFRLELQGKARCETVAGSWPSPGTRPDGRSRLKSDRLSASHPRSRAEDLGSRGSGILAVPTDETTEILGMRFAYPRMNPAREQRSSTCPGVIPAGAQRRAGTRGAGRGLGAWPLGSG
jgi:hypothetical protein